jgi:hypothetical protein
VTPEGGGVAWRYAARCAARDTTCACDTYCTCVPHATNVDPVANGSLSSISSSKPRERIASARAALTSRVSVSMRVAVGAGVRGGTDIAGLAGEPTGGGRAFFDACVTAGTLSSAQATGRPGGDSSSSRLCTRVHTMQMRTSTSYHMTSEPCICI